MKVIYSDRHRQHSPTSFLMRGQRVACPEVPQRADIFKRALDNHDLIECSDYGEAPVLAVHDQDYLNFLNAGYKTWSELDGASAEIVPNVHPNRNMNHCPDHIVAQAGFYQADTSCPIGEGTGIAAMSAAHCSLTAANLVLQGNTDDVAYALCRPPGHHAYADMAGGFCFINNTAVAAQYCRDHGAAKVAIIDIDVHHGNGTQGIFYHRSDVLTVSLHGDPNYFYPFYAGYADETGIENGVNANRNVPLKLGTSDCDYLAVLNAELEAVKQYGPDIVLIALGLDASQHDPLAFFKITTDGFRAIAAALSALALPTVLVQEGGYVSDVLGENLRAFVEGFEATRS